MEADYYRLLEIDRTASVNEIEKAFKRMALKVHPDKGGTKELMQQLLNAKTVLLSDGKADYDDKLDEEGTPFSSKDWGLLSSGSKLSEPYILEFETLRVSWASSDQWIDNLTDLKNTLLAFNDWFSQSSKALSDDSRRDKAQQKNSPTSDTHLSKDDFGIFLQDALYAQSISQVATVLLQMTQSNKHAAMHHLKGQGISTYPSGYRILLLAVRAIVRYHEDNVLGMVNDLMEVLLTVPDDESTSAVHLLIEHFPIRPRVVDAFKAHIIATLSSPMESSTTYSSSSSPTKRSYDNFPEPAYKERLKQTPYVRMIRKYEFSALKIADESKPNGSAFASITDCAYAFIDFAAALEDHTSLINSRLIAASLFLRASHHHTASYEQAYAATQLAINLSTEVFVIATKFSSPAMQLHFFRSVIDIMISSIARCHEIIAASNKFSMHGDRPFLREQDHIVILETCKSAIRSIRIHPMSIAIPSCAILDGLYIFHVQRDFLELHLRHRIQKKNSEEDLPLWLAQYHLYEGVWRGWFEGNFEQEKQSAMKLMLNSKNFQVEKVQSLMQWPAIPRTPDGWMLSKRSPLISESENFQEFTRIDGFEIDQDTGEIRFILEKIEGLGLFNLNDIFDILKSGIDCSVFTLDPPNSELQHHPFQEMRFLPAELENTRIMKCMFHCDYLLKMMSMGTEVSSVSPFDMRQSRDGFMKRLPEELQFILRPIHERSTSKLKPHETMHRFWIESEETIFEEFQVENVIRFNLKDPRMVVKSHRMKLDLDGNLVDDIGDMEESAELDFVNAFTDAYYLLGEYFPELLLLKEFAKMQAIVRVVQSTYESFKLKIQEFPHGDVRSAIANVVSEIGSQVSEYPSASKKSVIDQVVNDTLASSGYARSQVNMSDLESKVVDHLKKKDSSTLQQVTQVLAKLGEMQEINALSSLVHNWLVGRNAWRLSAWIQGYMFTPPEDALIDHILEEVKKAKIARWNSVISTMDKMKWKTTSSFDTSQDLHRVSKTCHWVPAAFTLPEIDATRSIKIYGGVSLQPRLRSAHWSEVASKGPIREAHPIPFSNMGEKVRRGLLVATATLGMTWGIHVDANQPRSVPMDKSRQQVVVTATKAGQVTAKNVGAVPKAKESMAAYISRMEDAPNAAGKGPDGRSYPYVATEKRNKGEHHDCSIPNLAKTKDGVCDIGFGHKLTNEEKRH